MAKKQNTDNGKMGDNSDDNPEAFNAEARAHVKELVPLEKILKDTRDKIKALNRSYKSVTGVSNKEFDGGRSDAEIENPDEQKKIINNRNRVFNALSGSDQITMVFNYPDEVQDKDDDTNAE